jgi:Domain of unknown function (DUF5668)
VATSYGPARQRRRGSVIGPLILIFIGGVFLLQNAGVLPPTIWGSLWRLWPLALVIVGLELLFGARAGWLVAIVGLCGIVVALGGVVAGNFGFPSPSRAGAITRTYDTQLGDAQQASVTVRFGAGQLDIGPLADSASGRLASMSYDGPGDLVSEPSYSVVGGNGRLDYQLNGRGAPGFLPFTNDTGATPHIAIDLAPSVPISTLQVQSGAADTRIDLTGLHVNNVDMAVGAASTRLRLPDAGITTVHVTGGASTITLEVPAGVAARIHHRGGLSTLNIDQTRFPSMGDEVYQSPNWDTATNRADINLETGVTTIQVN